MEVTKTTKKTATKAKKPLIPKDMPSANLTDRSFIQPIIKEAGKLHPLETLFDKGEMPTLVASGLYNLDKTKGRHWISYKITFQGDKILSLEVSEPGNMEDARVNASIDFQFNLEKAMEG